MSADTLLRSIILSVLKGPEGVVQRVGNTLVTGGSALQTIGWAVGSDESTPLAVAAGQLTFHLPYDF
jgi:hypothetical protein